MIKLINTEIKREYIIQIIHRYPTGVAEFYLFENINTRRLDFHPGYILVNNHSTVKFQIII
jgi:hypothetical protein